MYIIHLHMFFYNMLIQSRTNYENTIKTINYPLRAINKNENLIFFGNLVWKYLKKF